MKPEKEIQNTWINVFKNSNLSFRIYIIDKNESIIFHSKFNTNYSIVVLDGLMQILQIFTNGETICQKLINEQEIISNCFFIFYNEYSYYKGKALTKTVIAILKSTQILINTYHKPSQLYSNTFMTSILSYRSTKKRIIHLILHIAYMFGHFCKTSIIIELEITHKDISMITGSQRTNVTKIIKILKKKNIIGYQRKKLIIHDLMRLIKL